MRPQDTTNVTEVLMFLMAMPAFADCLSAEEQATVEQYIGQVSKADAHATVKLVYGSRKSMPEQKRQALIVIQPLKKDIIKRTADVQSFDRMSEDQTERLEAAPLDNDAAESSFAIVKEQQRLKPNENLATSEALMLAQINDPFGYIGDRTPEEKAAIWTRAREEEKKEIQRSKEALQELKAKKVEKMKKMIEDAKRREAKADKAQNEFKDTEPIHTREELDELLETMADSELRSAFLRDQIRNWNSKGVSTAELAIGKDGDTKRVTQLQEKLAHYLDKRLSAMLLDSAVKDQRPKRKQHALPAKRSPVKRAKQESSKSKKSAKTSSKKVKKEKKRQRDTGSKGKNGRHSKRMKVGKKK